MASKSGKKIDPVIQRVMQERDQTQETRKALYEELEDYLEKPVVSFFTSFIYPVGLEDSDVDMLAGFLQMMDLSNGLILIINSPGGDGLAAERMIKVCRTYSGTHEYDVIVPGKAKSAATMVCFGAKRIIMGPTSELGPVDPQIFIRGRGWIPAYHIVKSYNDLFRKAVREKGNLEPYLQQLADFNASVIEEYKAIIELSKDIPIRALQECMMRGKPSKQIERCIETFLEPENTRTHGRAIFADDAKRCGLSVESLPIHTKEWDAIYELYVRSDHFVSTRCAKFIENKENLFTAKWTSGEKDDET